jgi:hypothetical protein
MRRARAGFWIVPSLAAGWLPFESACEPLGGLSSGTPSDAGLEAQVDGPPPDAAAPVDAGASDGSSGWDGAGVLTFTTDFDDAGLTGWSGVTGTVTLDTSEYRSSPHSMRVTGGSAVGYLVKSMPGSWNRAKCTFQFRYSTTQSVELVYIGIESPSVAQQDYGVSMHASTNGANFYEGWNPDGGTRSVNGSALNPAPQATWIPVELDLDLANRVASLRFGGSTLQRTISPPAGVRLELGATFVQTGSQWDLHYDDVRCDLW